MRGSASPALALVVAFGLWKVVGTFFLGLTIDPLITPWEGGGTATLRNSTDVLRAFRNWDARHYLTIARDGYVDPAERAFYPLFPLLLRGMTTIFENPVVAGLVLTLLASSLFAVVYFHVAARLLSPRHAAVALPAVIAVPSALFLNCIYSESLFLLLLFLFLWFFLAESWLAGVFAALLVVTRGQGLFVGLGVLLVLGLESGRIWRTRDWPRARYLVGIGGGFAAGLLGYMAWQYWAFGDPLAFVHAQTTYYGASAGMTLGHSLSPRHVLAILFTPPIDLNGPMHGLIDKLCIYASLALAPAVWRLDRRLFAFYACLAYFPATIGYGSSYFRFFLLPYSIAALALARAYLERDAILGIAKERVAALGVALGLTLQFGLSLLYAAYRWIG
jgi:hypothetical protein